VLFPADVTGGSRPDFAGLELDFVIASPDADELIRVPLRFERSWATSAAIDAWGYDASQALATHVRIQRSGYWSADMRTTDAPLTASQAHLILELLAVVQPPNAVALTPPGTSPDAYSLLEKRNAPVPPEGLAEAVANLAILEAHVGEPVMLPEEFNARSFEDLQVAAELLRGAAVRGTWDQMKWPMTAAQAREVATGPLSEDAADLDVTRVWTVDLGDGRTYAIGPLSAHLRSVRVVTWPDTSGLPDDEQVEVIVEPADEDHAMDLRLRPSGSETPGPGQVMRDDDPATVVPPDVFDDLLAWLDEPAEAPPALARAAARLRAIRS